MLKKYMIIPLLLAVLGAAFALVSFLCFISRGRYVFIKQKLKIGALLLSLTAFSAGCQSNQDDIVLCYKAAAPTPHITIFNETNQNREIIVDPLLGRAITGTIQEDEQSYPHYSYRIVDNKGAVLQKGGLTITQTSAKQPRELCFEIIIDQDIPLGTFSLRLYHTDLKNQEQNPDGYFYVSRVQIIESMILCYDMAF